MDTAVHTLKNIRFLRVKITRNPAALGKMMRFLFISEPRTQVNAKRMKNV